MSSSLLEQAAQGRWDETWKNSKIGNSIPSHIRCLPESSDIPLAIALS